MAQNDIQIIQENAGSDYVYRILSGIANGKVMIINASSQPEFRVLEIADINGLVSALSGKIASTEKGVANGVASLGADGKVPTGQLPEAAGGGLNYLGTWNANTNTPTIAAASTSNKGGYYKVSVAGSTNIDGTTDWQVGDWIISNGTTWEKIDNTDAVSSVAGRTGAVTLTSSDVGLGNVANALQFLASNVDTDNTLTANSDSKVASQKAIKAFIASYAATVGHNHDSNYEAKNSNIQSHIADATVHVTPADKTNWNAKASTDAVTTSTNGLMIASDKVKLNAIADNANNYTHPANHSPSIITQDSSNRFVSDSEKSTWNGKLSWSSVPASATSTGTAGQVSYDDDYLYVCVATNKWKRIPMATWS
jgi:hypothetical protein